MEPQISVNGDSNISNLALNSANTTIANNTTTSSALKEKPTLDNLGKDITNVAKLREIGNYIVVWLDLRNDSANWTKEGVKYAKTELNIDVKEDEFLDFKDAEKYGVLIEDLRKQKLVTPGFLYVVGEVPREPYSKLEVDDEGWIKDGTIFSKTFSLKGIEAKTDPVRNNPMRNKFSYSIEAICNRTTTAFGLEFSSPVEEVKKALIEMRPEIFENDKSFENKIYLTWDFLDPDPARPWQEGNVLATLQGMQYNFMIDLEKQIGVGIILLPGAFNDGTSGKLINNGKSYLFYPKINPIIGLFETMPNAYRAGYETIKNMKTIRSEESWATGGDTFIETNYQHPTNLLKPNPYKKQ